MARLDQMNETERKHLENLECPTFDTHPWVEGPPLSQRRVAIISTAGLHARDDRPFTFDPHDYYRVIPGDIKANDLVMTHVSTNFDHTGFQQDWNVVFPIDRLQELAKNGIIGSVADFHYSFMGANDPMPMEQEARSVANLLKKDNVDAALLVPVWPFCTRAVGGLAHFIEEEGIPTTQISLIRLHTETTSPPRALWVPFELGRPFGVPGDIEFQTRVLLATLKLLEMPEGPILEDFTEDAPASKDRPTMLACPVNFPQDQAELTETEELCARLKSEMTAMRPWYEMAVKKRGRTTVGVSGLDPDKIPDFICSFLEGDVSEPPRKDISLPYVLNLAIDDLKAYYFEGITSQPGQEAPSSKALSDWFWGETTAAKVLFRIKDVCKKSENGLMKIVGKVLIVPVDQGHRNKQQ